MGIEGLDNVFRFKNYIVDATPENQSTEIMETAQNKPLFDLFAGEDRKFDADEMTEMMGLLVEAVNSDGNDEDFSDTDVENFLQTEYVKEYAATQGLNVEVLKDAIEDYMKQQAALTDTTGEKSYSNFHVNGSYFIISEDLLIQSRQLNRTITDLLETMETEQNKPLFDLFAGEDRKFDADEMTETIDLLVEAANSDGNDEDFSDADVENFLQTEYVKEYAATQGLNVEVLKDAIEDYMKQQAALTDTTGEKSYSNFHVNGGFIISKGLLIQSRQLNRTTTDLLDDGAGLVEEFSGRVPTAEDRAAAIQDRQGSLKELNLSEDGAIGHFINGINDMKKLIEADEKEPAKATEALAKNIVSVMKDNQSIKDMSPTEALDFIGKFSKEIEGLVLSKVLSQDEAEGLTKAVLKEVKSDEEFKGMIKGKLQNLAAEYGKITIDGTGELTITADTESNELAVSGEGTFQIRAGEGDGAKTWDVGIFGAAIAGLVSGKTVLTSGTVIAEVEKQKSATAEDAEQKEPDEVVPDADESAALQNRAKEAEQKQAEAEILPVEANKALAAEKETTIKAVAEAEAAMKLKEQELAAVNEALLAKEQELAEAQAALAAKEQELAAARQQQEEKAPLVEVPVEPPAVKEAPKPEPKKVTVQKWTNGSYGDCTVGNILSNHVTGANGTPYWRLPRAQQQALMQELLKLNPNAFINGDINKLKAGVELILPETAGGTSYTVK